MPRYGTLRIARHILYFPSLLKPNPEPSTPDIQPLASPLVRPTGDIHDTIYPMDYFSDLDLLAQLENAATGGGTDMHDKQDDQPETAVQAATPVSTSPPTDE